MAEGTLPDPAPSAPVRLQHEGGTADDHGRLPGAPSRVGTGSTALPSDPERVREANASGGNRASDSGLDAASRVAVHPVEPRGEQREKYELAFPGGADGADLVEVTRINRTGPGGHPVYEDATGIIQAEISSESEVRVLATGGGQSSVPGVMARPLS
ncbi:DUF6296 family protein [Streptomyces sp. NPDC056883]|uniref:DUF6296 family protein n=1 Tax=Streptomyces sp. NPDC056883 TaxID=3345959 RepID=UPI00369C3FF0